MKFVRSSPKSPKKIFTRYVFTTFHEDGKVSPVFEYYVKAGDWDGLINFSYIVEVDTNCRPIKLKKERITFIALPAKRSVKKRNLYVGFTLDPSELDSLILRLSKEDDFDDFLKKALDGDDVVHGKIAETDSWTKLQDQ